MNEHRVLVVENDRVVRHDLYRALLDQEIFADSVSDSGEALERLREQRYAVIILDVAIAGGAQAVIDAVQQMPNGQQPILIATAETESIGNLDAETVQVVIRRPVRVRDVAELARACIETSSERRRRAAEADELRT